MIKKIIFLCFLLLCSCSQLSEDQIIEDFVAKKTAFEKNLSVNTPWRSPAPLNIKKGSTTSKISSEVIDVQPEFVVHKVEFLLELINFDARECHKIYFVTVKKNLIAAVYIKIEE